MINMKQKITNDLKGILGNLLKYPAEKIDDQDEFGDLGLDSTQAMELVTKVSNHYNIKFSPAKMVSVSTIKNMSEMFCDEFNEQLTAFYNNDSPVTSTVPQEDRIESKSQIASITFSTHIAPKTVPISFLNDISEKYNIPLCSEIVNARDINQVVDILTEKYRDKMHSYYKPECCPGTIATATPEPTATISTENKTSTEPIAIIGMSAALPDSPNLDIFWDNLINGKNSIKEVPETRWDWKQFYSEKVEPGKTISKWAALLDDVESFDPSFFKISPEEAVLIDPQERIVLQETYKALEDAGLNVDMLSGTKTGVFIGYEYSEYELHLKQTRLNQTTGDLPFFSSSNRSYNFANRISFLFDLTGPSEAINVNCASSATSINRAYYSLLNNECDIAIVGGVCLNLFPEDYIASGDALSPDGSCKVFDEHANGYTRGEGCGIIILKRLDQAKKDRDRIYTLIKSCSLNNRGFSKSPSDIKPEAITDVVEDCYKRVGVNPETVQYVEVNGFSTKWGDLVEYDALKKVFSNSTNKENEKNCGLGSLKGNIGNLEPASGVVSVIKMALSMANKQFPGTISCDTVNEFIDVQDESHPLYLMTKNSTFEELKKNSHSPIRAGVNSFAYSGVHVHILLEEYIESEPHIKESIQNNNRQIVILSAKNKNCLEERASNLLSFLQRDNISAPELTNITFTLQTGRQVMEYRMALVVKSLDELVMNLKEYLDSVHGNKKIKPSSPIYIGECKNVSQEDGLSLRKIEELAKQDPEKLALYWVQGEEIPWNELYGELKPYPVSLPTYPFSKEHYFVSKNNNETTGDVELFLKELLAKQLNKPTNSIKTDVDYFDMGLSSLGLVKVIQELGSKIGEKLSPSLLLTYNTISLFSAYLSSNYSSYFDQKRSIKNNGSKKILEKNIVTPPTRSSVLNQEKALNVYNNNETVTGKGKDVIETLEKVIEGVISLDEAEYQIDEFRQHADFGKNNYAQQKREPYLS